MIRIGVLLGSSRPNGNGLGLEKWVRNNFQDRDNFELVHIFPHHAVHPIGPIVDETISAMVRDGSYASEKVQEWSSLVRSFHGFIIITPQHNWGYPGELKTALDHLYHEWRGKPVFIVTYGGHGGEKCNAQLRQVLGGLKMKIVEQNVCITLPEDYIRSVQRIDRQEGSEEGDSDEFLRDYAEPLSTAIEQFKALITDSADQK